MRNGTILTLRIIPDRKLHAISFQIACSVAVCTVGKACTYQLIQHKYKAIVLYIKTL